jgi:hypothetical protein
MDGTITIFLGRASPLFEEIGDPKKRRYHSNWLSMSVMRDIFAACGLFLPSDAAITDVDESTSATSTDCGRFTRSLEKRLR